MLRFAEERERISGTAVPGGSRGSVAQSTANFGL